MEKIKMERMKDEGIKWDVVYQGLRFIASSLRRFIDSSLHRFGASSIYRL